MKPDFKKIANDYHVLAGEELQKALEKAFVQGMEHKAEIDLDSSES